MLTLTKDQLKGMWLFSNYVRENENELCNYCLKNLSTKKYKSSKCTCEGGKLVADFKLYEKLLPFVTVTEMYYFYDLYTRYVYVLNQAYVVLRVFDLDELESKHEDDMDGFDTLLESNVFKSPILTLQYACCAHQKINYTITRFLKPFEELVEELFSWLEDSFSETEVQQQLVMLFSVIHNPSWYEHEVLLRYECARNVWEKLSESI